MSKELIVYKLESQDGTCRIVASPTKARAATLLGVTTYLLATYGGLSNDPEEVELAVSDPGAVWALKPNGQKWVKVASSNKAGALNGHGGRRSGAGKRPLGEGPAKQRWLSLDDASYATYTARGGVQFLRNVLASGLDLNDQEWADLEQLGGVAWLREQLEAARKTTK
jgi:hypothetical protein